MRGIRSLTVAVGMGALAWMAAPAGAFHTPFTYRVDRFELDGNEHGANDGVPDLVDDFADGVLSPTWYTAYGTASESSGYLVVQNPGVHFPSPDGSALDLSIAGSSSPTWVYDGMGSFTATAYWEGVVPPVGHHYHFSLYTFNMSGGLFAETFGLAIRRTETGVDMEQHLTEIDQFSGTFQNTQLLFHAIDENDVTGQLVFRIAFDDTTNQATTAFSLDGGATWQSPFPPGTIFVGRTVAQFLLSADPFGASAGTTTTTTPTSSTTTTTLAGTCALTGCRRSTEPKGRLSLRNRGTFNSIKWKWKKGEETEFFDLAPPQSTSYEFCIGDASGTPLVRITVPSGSLCDGDPCWDEVHSSAGWSFRDGDGQFDGLERITILAGPEGRAKVKVEAEGPQVVLPFQPVILPIVVRLRGADGNCWAETYTSVGVRRNTAKQFSARPGSPSGAFTD